MIGKIDNTDVIVIGGGLAGLTTAALLARAGKSVTLFEQSSSEIGGCARTSIYDGFYFNQGPHALFPAAAGAAVLQELGIAYTGEIPAPTGLRIRHEEKYRLLANGSSPSTTSKSQNISEEAIGQFFDLVSKIDFIELENVSVQEWIDDGVFSVGRPTDRVALRILFTEARKDNISFLPVQDTTPAKIYWLNRRAVGYYSYSYNPGEYPTLRQLFVMPEYRRRGIATEMIKDFLDTFKDSERISIESPNTDIHEILVKLGLSERIKERDSYKSKGWISFISSGM